MIADPFLFLLDSIAQHFARAFQRYCTQLSDPYVEPLSNVACRRTTLQPSYIPCDVHALWSWYHGLANPPPLPLLSLSSTWKILISPEGGYERERERENERQDEQTMTTVDWDSNRELERHAVFFPPFWVSTTFTIPQRHMFSRNWWPQSWKG